MTSASTDAPRETGAPIDHILTRYHEMHRVDAASPVPLAERVERVHEHDPDAPRGLARALAALGQEMQDHMAREEMILFPAGLGWGLFRPDAGRAFSLPRYHRPRAVGGKADHDLSPTP